MSSLPPSALVVFALLLGTSPRGEAQPIPANSDFAGSVDVGGRELFIECRGSGSPIVVLISGYRNTGEIWTVENEPAQTMVMPGVASFTRVCAYDRPGTILDASRRSESDPVAMPRTADEIVSELHALLESGSILPPYVLVAHSLGGLFARLYASTYPDDVVGLVLVDAWSEALPSLLGPDQWRSYQDLAGAAPPGLEDYHALEMVDFGAASHLMQHAAVDTPLREMPLFILSRGRRMALPPGVPATFSLAAFERAWRCGQIGLTKLLPDARHRIATESDHYIQIEQPDLVIDAVREVVEAVRDPASRHQRDIK